MPLLDRIKVYAEEGFIWRGEGTAEEFARLWQLPFPAIASSPTARKRSTASADKGISARKAAGRKGNKN